MQTIPRIRPADESEVAAHPPAPRRLRVLLRRDRRTLSSGRLHPAAVEELPLASGEVGAFDTTAEDVSPPFERLLVMTAEQALEEDPRPPQLHSLDRERVLHEWQLWCADPAAEPFRCSYRMLTADGRVIWVDEETFPAGRAAASSGSSAVRCLACGAHYLRSPGHGALPPSNCPRCEYVGWTAAV